MDLAELIDQYLIDRRSADACCAAHANLLRLGLNRTLAIIGNKPIDEIKSANVLGFREWLQQSRYRG